MKIENPRTMHSSLKLLVSAAAVGSLPFNADAAITLGDVYFVEAAVPDNSIIGLSDTRRITSGITSITSVTGQLFIQRDTFKGRKIETTDCTDFTDV